MADRTNMSGVAISSGYLQHLMTAITTGVPEDTDDPLISIVYSAGGKKSCFAIGEAECHIIDGATNFDIKSHDGSNGLKLGGTLVSSTAAELNYVDKSSAVGINEASKAMVTDSSGDYEMQDSDKIMFGTGSDMQLYHDSSNSYITNAVGALKIATETSGIAVTIGHTTSEVTVADNLTVTGTLTLGSGAELTEAELEMLDGITAGTALASKALVVDSNKDIGTIRNLTIDGVLTDGNYTFDTSGNVSGLGTVASGAITSSGIIKTDVTTEATSTTDGSLQTDGGLSVVKDCIFGDDVKLLSDSAVLNLGAGNDVTLTHDGTTGGTLAGTPISINSTGDLTLDSTTDIVIDSAGGNIEFKDAGTLQLTLDMDTTAGVQILKLGVDTDDLVFQQYDGNEVCRMADDRRLYFYDKGGEYISSDGTDLTLASGNTVNIATKVIMTDTSVAHGITNVAPTDAYGDIGKIHATYGGLYINGMSDQESADARSLALRGICNDTHTDTVPTVEIIGAKRSGTTVQALANAETVLQVANHTTTLMTVLGSGNLGIGTATPNASLDVQGSTTRVGSAWNVYSKDIDIRYAHSGDNTVVVQLLNDDGSVLKIPAQAFIYKIFTCIKTVTNTSTFACNVQLSATSGTAVDASISSGTEILGAGDANTDSSDSGTASDIAMGNSAGNAKEVWCRYPKNFIDIGMADAYVYICNAGTGNGTTNPTSGTLSVYIEWFGLD